VDGPATHHIITHSQKYIITVMRDQKVLGLALLGMMRIKLWMEVLQQFHLEKHIHR